MPDLTIEDKVVSLRRGQQRLQTGQDQLIERVDGLAHTVTELGQMVSRLHRGGEAKEGEDTDARPPLVCWLTVNDPELVAEVAADLVRWLQQVFVYYGYQLPTCWPWHPPLVEQLLALRHTHWAAYSAKKVSEQARWDWHEKTLPGFAKLLGPLLSHTLDDHRPGKAVPLVPIPMVTALPRVAEWWACQDGDPRQLPEPTEWELGEASRHGDLQTRRGRAS